MEQDRLWALLGELSRQLSSNVSQVEMLKRQAEELKTQAVHSSTGFTLRRFNVDISKEQFETELERLNATLVLENHALQHENKQLSMLLKDYEGTLENVMNRFRSYAFSTQMHDLGMVRHYESMLSQQDANHQQQQQQQRRSSSSQSNAFALAGTSLSDTDDAPFQDPFELQSSLFRMAQLLRKALRVSQGEDPSPPDSPSDDGKTASEFGVPPSGSELQAKLGGYLALLSREASGKGGGAKATTNGKDIIVDDAMSREIELERLRCENDQLRDV